MIHRDHVACDEWFKGGDDGAAGMFDFGVMEVLLTILALAECFNPESLGMFLA